MAHVASDPLEPVAHSCVDSWLVQQSATFPVKQGCLSEDQGLEQPIFGSYTKKQDKEIFDEMI